MCVMNLSVWSRVTPVSGVEITEPFTSALWQRQRRRIIKGINEEKAAFFLAIWGKNSRTTAAYKMKIKKQY